MEILPILKAIHEGVPDHVGGGFLQVRLSLPEFLIRLWGFVVLAAPLVCD